MIGCSNPYITATGVYPCGTCLHCRLQNRAVWVTRLLLESTRHPAVSWATLTYSDEFCDGSLHKRHVQLFLKRLRHKYPSLRYFITGEYGDRTLRPHYHAVLYSVPSCHWGRTRLADEDGCCEHCRTVAKAWRLGGVLLGTFEPSSAAYTAGYVVDKARKPIPDGVTPPFRLMSLRPAIGKLTATDIARSIVEHLDDRCDVPYSIRVGRQYYQLGPQMRRYIRVALGRSKYALPKPFTAKDLLVALARQSGLGLTEFFRRASQQRQIELDSRYPVGD